MGSDKALTDRMDGCLSAKPAKLGKLKSQKKKIAAQNSELNPTLSVSDRLVFTVNNCLLGEEERSTKGI